MRRRPVALALGLWCVATWGSFAPGAVHAQSQSQASEQAVPVALVAPHALGQGVELDGSLQAVRQSTLSAQATGRISQLSVKAGDRVRAGQVLATIDDRMTQAGVSQAQAQVAQADAQLANARAQYERTRDLLAQGFVSKSALDVAQAQYKSAQAGANGAVAGQAQTQVAQGHTRLTAPFDGWVLSTQAEAGDLAMPGTPVLTVYAPQPLRAVVHVPASRQGLANKAPSVEVKLPDGRWVVPAARTSLPAADPVSQTVEWRLDLAAADAAGLVPGQQVQVRFSGTQAQRLTVPAQAVLRRGELTAVYVAREGDGKPGNPAFVLRALRLGQNQGAVGIEVLSGLSGQERVALDPVRAGLAGARVGATVQP
ncbi:MAG: efflux RND transporter periplasmic adaptor subunit [Burkholderiales bacterium]|nr:efflux RND transporter periplasmic adaptor subunit [Burkholderiales bacterium]